MTLPQKPMQVYLAPHELWQAINPWFAYMFAGSRGDQIGLFNVSIGSGNDEIEREILRQDGSYGKQLGHLAEAFEVLLDAVASIEPDPLRNLTKGQKAVLALARSDLARVKATKDKVKASPHHAANGPA